MGMMLNHLSSARWRSLQLIYFTTPMTALPGILQSLNATYTRNSEKRVVQDGALVTLAANQFGTSYDPVTGLYGYVPEPAATNSLFNSRCSGPSGAPTDWLVSGLATISSSSSALGGSVNRLNFTATNNYGFAYQSKAAEANTTYAVSCYVESVSGGLTANQVINHNTALAPAGYSVSYPVCQANPSGGSSGVVTTGLLVVLFTTAGTSGSFFVRFGAGSAATNVTGSVSLSYFQYESGSRATSRIVTPVGSTASRAADVLSVPLWVNNLRDSQDGSTANWSRNNCAVTTSGTAPDGTATAQLITASTTASTTLYNGSCKAPSSTVTYSVYVKQGNRATCSLLLRNSTTSTNFAAGTLTFATGVISGTGWSATSVGNGWYRCTFTQATGINVGDTLFGYAHFVATAATAGDTGYFWGAQIEAGSTATTYRPTTSTLASVANQNIPGFVESGYTLFVDGRFDVANLSTGRRLTMVDDGTDSNRVIQQGHSTNSYGTTVTSGAVSQSDTAQTALSIDRFKFSVSVAGNSFLRAVNGVTGTPDMSGAMPISPTFVRIGAAVNGTAQANGFLFRAGLIPQALTQAQINGLTTL